MGVIVTLAREVAVRVLVRVEKERAFAAAALESEIERAVQLKPQDRALVTELVYGTLRVGPWLMSKLDRFAPRGTSKLDAHVRACLMLGAYQLFFTRVPAFAAVNEAVQAIRDARGQRLGAFANAVLRKVAADAAEPRDTEKVRQEAVIASTPAWLRTALERSLTRDAEGERASGEEAHAFLRCSAEVPAVALRVEHALEREGEREHWLARLRADAPDATFEPGRISPLAILVRGAGRVQRLAGFSEGAWSVQEEGSQFAALAVGARAGETVLDACAGRGNKTAILARAVGQTGAVDACDASPAKLERLVIELERVGVKPRATFAVDWSVGSGDVTALYDRVLVDAPCSGVGTLARRPEIGLRREPADLRALADLQLAIARRAAAHVRPGGALVYVVCSVLREEGEAVIGALVEACPSLSLAEDAPSASPLRLLPHVHGTDGYFVARLVRR